MDELSLPISNQARASRSLASSSARSHPHHPSPFLPRVCSSSAATWGAVRRTGHRATVLAGCDQRCFRGEPELQRGRLGAATIERRSWNQRFQKIQRWREKLQRLSDFAGTGHARSYAVAESCNRCRRCWSQCCAELRRVLTELMLFFCCNRHLWILL